MAAYRLLKCWSHYPRVDFYESGPRETHILIEYDDRLTNLCDMRGASFQFLSHNSPPSKSPISAIFSFVFGQFLNAQQVHLENY
ncbi:hypothetical protein C0Z16_35005 [Paraburkholderia rhynchosiae]|nr:hypothetical protein C0Z16_35005 [Paraburkholderia rhynchosiae]